VRSSSEQLAFFGRQIVTVGQELLSRAGVGFQGFLSQSEKLIPGRRAPRQNYVPGFFVFANENLFALESEFYRQAHRLASAVPE
jgi:hypothetical protein